jgi:putative flippase GtrA
MSTLPQLLRYGAVGLANTAATMAVIAACLAVGWGDYPANVLGYAVGLSLSFFANRRFTFGIRNHASWSEARGFLAAFAIAYTLNLAVIWCGRSAGMTGSPLIHLAGMVLYSGAFYIAMGRLAFRESEGPSATRGLTVHAPPFALGVAAIATLLVMTDNPLTHDVVWQFWIARQLLAGAELYRDIWEVNPPLWFWSAMPIEALGAATDVSPFRYLNALIVAWGAFAAWSTWRLMGDNSARSGVWVACSAFALVIWTEPFDFAQREQLALIGALPYAALIARRRQGERVDLALAVPIAALAAYGFALKHYFALIPMLLEVWLFVGRHKAWGGAGYRPVRTETVLLAAGAALYGGAILLLAPAFLSEMVPMVSLAYGGYEEPLWRWVDEPAQIVWGLAAVALLHSHRRGPGARPMQVAALIVAGGFFASYLLQAKGWQYHAMPVSAALLFACAVRMIDARGPARLLLGVPFVTALLIAQVHGHYRNYLRDQNEPLLQRAPEGAPVAVFSADPMWAWPTIEENGQVWALNLYSHWMLPTIGRAEVDRNASPKLRRLADRIRRQAVRDMACRPPAVILFEREPRYPLQPKSFDVTAFFLRDPRFAQFMAAHYREGRATAGFRIFDRIGRIAPAAGCRVVASPSWPVEHRDINGRVIALRAPSPAT